MADLPDREEKEEPKPWENPYNYQVLYHTLRAEKLKEDPTDPMFSPEEIQLRQAQNDYNQRMGRIFSLSGDKRVSDLGGTVLKEAIAQARPVRTDHGEFNPLTGQHRYFPDYVKNRELERNDTALFRATQLANQVQAQHDAQEDRQRHDIETRGPLRAAQEDAARAKADRDRAKAALEAAGKNLDQGTKKTLSGVGEVWDELKYLRTAFNKANYKPPAGGWSDLGTFQDWMVQKNPNLAPKEWKDARNMQGLFTKLATLKQRHDIFGAVLPPKEFADFAKTQPPRGASKKDLDAWFAQELELVERALKSVVDGAVAGNYNKGQIEAHSRGFYTAPVERSFGSMGGGGEVDPGPQGGGVRYNPLTGEVE